MNLKITNYTCNFAAKPMQPTKAVRRESQPKVLGKFEGLPTYKSKLLYALYHCGPVVWIVRCYITFASISLSIYCHL